MAEESNDSKAPVSLHSTLHFYFTGLYNTRLIQASFI